MIKIITTKRYNQMVERLAQLQSALLQQQSEVRQVTNKNTLHCGRKSCQFNTESPAGLAIHRAKAHK